MEAHVDSDKLTNPEIKIPETNSEIISVKDSKTEDLNLKIEEITDDKVQYRTVYFYGSNTTIPKSGEIVPKNAVFCYPDNAIRTTKYTIFTFLPRNLFEQFRRLANFYFLLIAMIQLIPGLSNIDPMSSIAPLAFVLTVTAVKEAYEDWKRRQSDKEVNHRCSLILREKRITETSGIELKPENCEFEEVMWKDIQVGDVIKITQDQWIPADMVLLSTSLDEGMCYIQTANLDGETNLKVRQALKETTNLNEPETIINYKGIIECELPNKDLYKYEGTLFSESNLDKRYSLSSKQLLLRGCLLKNTEWVIGIVVFTGHESKLMKNARSPPAKRSSVEKLMNQALITIFAFMFSICIFSALFGALIMDNKHWYLDLGDEPDNKGFNIIWSLGSYLILFSYMIPISLYVSMEIVKLVQTFMLNQDLRMYDEESDTPAKARTSNLNEELGQIEYIFSDKTGTLTCNIMELVKCSIAGNAYSLIDNEDVTLETSHDSSASKPITVYSKTSLLSKIDNSDDLIIDFFVLLAVCHTVLPEHVDESTIKYQASSPDEFALVSRASDFGFSLKSRTLTSVFVDIKGKIMEYKILNINEFNNVRKRMSVVCRTPDGKIKLYCKGADMMILSRLSSDHAASSASTLNHLQLFAAEGLRTLCCSVVELSEDQYKQWNHKYHEASISLDNRDEKMEAVAEEIEKNMTLLGATAIEDKLQDGVPETIASLKQAGFHIWVLTGDKKETAINIGFSCQLLPSDVIPIIIESAKDIDNAISNYLESKDHHSDSEYGLVIEGPTLDVALSTVVNQQKFLRLALACKTVICCRATPSQKRDVVRLVRKNCNVRTLSIGDGANDVSMIQEAHVGIGILGKEGMQAAMSSDYAIAQFKFLRILLQIHGRWSYNRISKLVLYCFYKNMAFALTQFWFNLYALFSAQNLFDSWIIIVYNVVFTAFPVLVYAIFDQDVTADQALKNPELYYYGPNNLSFNMKLLWGWLIEGIFHSVVIFFGSILIWGDGILDSGASNSGLWGLGVLVYTVVIITVNLKIALETDHWISLTHITIWGSIVAWMLYAIIYSSIFGLSPDNMYWVVHNLMRTAAFWLGIIILPAICLLPDLVYKYVKRNYFPENYHIVQEIQKFEGKLKRKDRLKQSIKSAYRAVVHLRSTFLQSNQSQQTAPSDKQGETNHTGFAFAQEEGQVNALRVATLRNLGIHRKKEHKEPDVQ